jgi:hypothetical protein
MAYKLGLLLSLFFVIEVIAFSGDLYFLSYIHSELDAVSLTASYEISMQGYITDYVKTYVQEKAHAYIVKVGDDTPRFGEALTFKVYRSYSPLIIANQTMTVSVTRSAVIGYFN